MPNDVPGEARKQTGLRAEGEGNTIDSATCSSTELAAHVLSWQKDAAGTASRNLDHLSGHSCLPAEKFQTMEQMLLDQIKRRNAGQPLLSAFALKSNPRINDLDHYVADALAGLEQVMGYKPEKVLWFKDDNGDAQVFILEQKRQAKTQVQACADVFSLPSEIYNRENNIPPGTALGDAEAVVMQRWMQALLVEKAMPPNTTPEQQMMLQNERIAKAADWSTRLSGEALIRALRAIDLDLDPGTPKEAVDVKDVECKQEARAIRAGLDQFAPLASIETAEAAMGAVLDSNLNTSLNLDANIPYSQAKKYQDDRNDLASLLHDGLENEPNKDIVQSTRVSRNKRMQELTEQLMNPALSLEIRGQLELARDAVDLGLEETSSLEKILATAAERTLKARAAIIGLPTNSTEEAVERIELDIELRKPPPPCYFNEQVSADDTTDSASQQQQ